MTAALFLALGELATEGTPCQLPLATLEAVDAAWFSPGELRCALQLAQSLADSGDSAEAPECLAGNGMGGAF